MEAAITKRSKLISGVFFLIAILAFLSNKAYAREVEEYETEQQNETTLNDDTDVEFLDDAEPMDYTESDLKLLATVMYAEAGICDDAELYRVANVVVNRVNDEGTMFKNSIEGVIYQSGQFTSIGGQAWNRGPTDREMEIAKKVLEGARVFPEGVVWFSKGWQYGELYYKSTWHCFSQITTN